MKYAIIGSAKIGTALARIFVRKNIEVAIANIRGPETLSSLSKELGPSAFFQSTPDAYKAEMIFLPVPFRARLRQSLEWQAHSQVQ
jgi:predicted dinucleotide-binding enzyme